MHSRLFPGILWGGIRWKNLGAVVMWPAFDHGIWNPWIHILWCIQVWLYLLVTHWNSFLIKWKFFTGTMCWNTYEYESLGQTYEYESLGQVLVCFSSEKSSKSGLVAPSWSSWSLEIFKKIIDRTLCILASVLDHSPSEQFCFIIPIFNLSCALCVHCLL